MVEINEKLYDLGLNTSAFKVLCFLTFKEGAMKPSQIAEGLGEKPSTVRARLSELKTAKLISSTSNGYVSNLSPYDILMKLYHEINIKLED